MGLHLLEAVPCVQLAQLEHLHVGCLAQGVKAGVLELVWDPCKLLIDLRSYVGSQ